MTEKDSHLIVSADGGGDVQCFTGAGCIQISAETFAAMVELRDNLSLALDCLDVFAGVPIPVKQSIMRSISTARQGLFHAHLMHDMKHGVSEGEVH